MKKQPSVHNPDRVLVVGTTPDYIDWIRKSRPGQAIFLTDPKIREHAEEPPPEDGEEILCPLDDLEVARAALDVHLEQWHIRLCGIACFDCENMETAAGLATGRGLPYPAVEAIRTSRDKYISKQLWQKNGIACPAAKGINEIKDAISLLAEAPDGIVLKPFSGSGSELVFKCRTRKECRLAFETLKQGLKAKGGDRLFKNISSGQYLMLAEAYVEGPEYSCDFMIANGKASIIRKTRKIKSATRPFGTASGYMLCPHPDKDYDLLEALFLKAAAVLGIERSICMVDFIVKDEQPVLIEMTPRPGGDCLPYLLKEAGNLDIIGLTLDFASQASLEFNGSVSYEPLIGLRIHAGKGGILKGIGTEGLRNERGIRQLHLSRKPGHVINMPPLDYDSWLLGHMILEPAEGKFSETQCLAIGKRLNIEIEEKGPKQ